MRGGDVLAALKGIPEVVICEILSGDYDIMVRLEAASPGTRTSRLGEHRPDARRTGHGHRPHPVQHRQPSPKKRRTTPSG
ncbi:Lrp/AsnC ligand binding domain-containing protein [Streptomyces coeruleorubidus]|uniref:Lrp/AsnC ligand binding domain-containing protein n=1 Tax=Streptomyces coeruleorubidus TaxID=116188 RepID=UPI00315816A2